MNFLRILNLGSLNMDRVYSVDHFVTAGETILAKQYDIFLGGKGLNQSLAAARAGAKVWHAGAIGFDGDSLRELLDHNGVDTQFLQQLDDVSGHAIIQSAHGQNCIIVHGGANSRITPKYIDSVLSHFSPGDYLLLQNEITCVPYALEQAKRRGMRIAFNVAPITPDMGDYPMECVDYLLVNEVEGKALCGIDRQGNKAVFEALMNRYPGTAVILTVGSEGAYYGRGTTRLHHGIYDVDVADTTAAGDTFCGYFIASISKGLDESRALEYASLASNLTVSIKGASNSIPFMEDVERFRQELNARVRMT